MVNNILRIIIDWFGKAYIDPSIRLAKVKAAIYYLQAIKAARGVVIGICLLLFVLTMIGAGLVLVPLALIMWAPWTNETKVIVGIIIGAVYVLVPVISAMVFLSQKRWMRMTGASTMLEDVCNPD